MADEFSLGDLAGMFSLGGGESSGPAFGGGYNLDVGGAGAAAPAFDASTLPTLPTSAGDGINFGDIAGKIGSGVKAVTEPVGAIAKPLLPLAGLATAGMGIAGGVQGAKTSAQQAQIQRQSQRMQQEAAGATRAAAAPLTQFGEQQLQQASAGQIPPAIQAKIDLWKQSYMAKVRDRMARMGQGDSDALMQWEQYAEQQAKAMEAEYLQEEQRLGIQGLTQGAQTIASAGGQSGNVAQGAQAEGQSIVSLMEQANKVWASLDAAAA